MLRGSRLDLKTATEYVDGARTFVGYQCQAAFVVESRALDDVEPLLVDVVAAGANKIEGVDFDVIAKRELRAEARRRAVVAARAKADLYAGAAAATAQDLAPGHIVVSAAVILGCAVTRD